MQLILLATLSSLPFYYLSLDFAKALINRVFVAHIREEAVSVELFGINATNYGQFVLERPAWEQRYGFDASTLPRAELQPAAS